MVYLITSSTSLYLILRRSSDIQEGCFIVFIADFE